MNSKAEQFKNFLEEREINVFQMEEIEGNEQHAVVFRSFIAVEGQQLPTMVVIDDSMFSIIRVQIVPQVLNKNNVAELMRLANEQNLIYKPFKLFFDARGDLMLDSCLMTDGAKLDGNAIYQLFNVIVNYLDENYRTIMKTVWR